MADYRKIARRLVFGKGGPEPEAKPMTRGSQTAWIIAAMALIFGGYIVYQERNDPTDRYAECWPTYSAGCKAGVAVRRINGY